MATISGEGKEASLLIAVQGLEDAVDKLNHIIDFPQEPTSDVKETRTAPTPAEGKVMDATLRILRVTRQLGEVSRVAASLLNAIGD